VNRDFRLLWIGQALSGLGAEVSSVAYPLLVLATTGSAAKAGLVALVAGAPFVLLQLPAGAYIDRWNRRAVMLAADLGRAVALGAVAFGHLPFAGLLVVAAVEGSLFVLFRLAEGAALRQVVDEVASIRTPLPAPPPVATRPARSPRGCGPPGTTGSCVPPHC